MKETLNKNEQIVVDMELWAANRGLEFKKDTSNSGGAIKLYYLEDSSGHYVSDSFELDKWTSKLDEHSDTILQEIYS